MKTIQKGFTLVEVLIVIAIVAILSSVALPAYQNQVERGNLSECTAFAYSLASQLEQFYTLNQTYPASLSANTGLGLGAAGVVSETGKCSAAINGIGGTCAVNDVAQRCHGYTLTLTRATSNSSSLRDTCSALTLTHRGQKGATSSGGGASSVDDCWR